MLLPLCLPWVYFLVTAWIFISVWCPALFMRLVMWGLTGSGFSQIFFLRLCHLRFLIVVKYTQAPLPLAQCPPVPFRASLHPRRTPGHPPPARPPAAQSVRRVRTFESISSRGHRVSRRRVCGPFTQPCCRAHCGAAVGMTFLVTRVHCSGEHTTGQPVAPEWVLRFSWCGRCCCEHLWVGGGFSFLRWTCWAIQ